MKEACQGQVLEGSARLLYGTCSSNRPFLQKPPDAEEESTFSLLFLGCNEPQNDSTPPAHAPHTRSTLRKWAAVPYTQNATTFAAQCCHSSASSGIRRRSSCLNPRQTAPRPVAGIGGGNRVHVSGIPGIPGPPLIYIMVFTMIKRYL